MKSESQIFPKKQLCSDGETSKTLDLSARWLYSLPLPWRLSKNKFILFERSRDKTIVSYSITAIVNGEEGDRTFFVNDY